MPQTAEIQDLKRMFFSASSVRALQDGRKSQTRRLLPDWCQEAGRVMRSESLGYSMEKMDGEKVTRFVWAGEGTTRQVHPQYPPGTYLVAEPLYAEVDPDEHEYAYYKADNRPVRSQYPNDNVRVEWPYQRPNIPSTFCRKEFCRYKIDVTDVRVERLGDISAEDIAEEGVRWGVAPSPNPSALEGFVARWEKIHGEGSWEEDKERWVWVYDLAPIQRLDRD